MCVQVVVGEEVVGAGVDVAVDQSLGAPVEEGVQGPRWFRTVRITSARLTTEPVDDHDLTELFGPPPDDAHPVSLPT